MKQNQKQSAYSIAWFKIAECVLRGEKERALGVHRLLAHSLGNNALSYQLEGDILFACGDAQKAVQVYKSAGHEYAKQKKYEQAAGVYEHILVLHPDDLLVYGLLFKVYMAANIESKIMQTAFCYIQLLIKSGDNSLPQRILADLSTIVAVQQQIILYERILHIPYVQEQKTSELREYLIKRIVHMYQLGEDQGQIETFLQRLSTIMPDQVSVVLSYMDDK